MTRREALIGLPAALSLLALSSCDTFSLTYRYRLTVEVDTPEGLKTGSSVIAIKVSELRPNSTLIGGAGADARGEAVAVDLPSGRTLFALLRGEPGSPFGAEGFPEVAYSERVNAVAGRRGNDNLPAWWRALADQREKVVLPRMAPNAAPPPYTETFPSYPLLVTFSDVNDPKTVVRVDPENLAASFGPGVKLRRIMVQITEDRMTTGIEKRLAWLPIVYQKLDKSFQPEGIPVGDFQRLFSTEISK